MTGATTDDMVKAYTEGGWQADAAVLDALAAVSHYQDQDGGVRGRRPRLHPLASRRRRTVPAARQARAVARSRPAPAADVSSGTCVLFADGLRYDVGQKLKAALKPSGSERPSCGTISPLCRR